MEERERVPQKVPSTIDLNPMARTSLTEAQMRDQIPAMAAPEQNPPFFEYFPQSAMVAPMP